MTAHNWHQGVYGAGAFKLDYLQATKPISARYISTFLTSFMHSPFSYMQGKWQPIIDSKSGWRQGVYVAGAFKLDYLQSEKPISARYISTFLTSFMHNPFSCMQGK